MGAVRTQFVVIASLTASIADLNGSALRAALKRMDAVLAGLRSVDAAD
jgi:hypothetical protein